MRRRREKLIALRTATFRQLCEDCTTVLEIVARFLGLLELYREGLVTFEQVDALAELTVTWIGDDEAGMDIRVDEYGDGDPEVVGELVTEDDDDKGFELPEGYVLDDADIPGEDRDTGSPGEQEEEEAP